MVKPMVITYHPAKDTPARVEKRSPSPTPFKPSPAPPEQAGDTMAELPEEVEVKVTAPVSDEEAYAHRMVALEGEERSNGCAPTDILDPRMSFAPPLPGLQQGQDFMNHAGVNMYIAGHSDEEEVSPEEDSQDGPEAYETGDPITAIKVNLWRPVLESYEFFQFEVTKRLHLLSKTTEFFQFVHKHLVDELVIIESKFPQVHDWKRRTSVMFDFKRKNNVGTKPGKSTFRTSMAAPVSGLIRPGLLRLKRPP